MALVCLNKNKKCCLLEVKDSQIGDSEWTIVADLFMTITILNYLK
jgi:hypothetical protein